MEWKYLARSRGTIYNILNLFVIKGSIIALDLFLKKTEPKLHIGHAGAIYKSWTLKE